ncbi:MAG: hypothetical protein RIS43_1051, partial [Actinomycetota bacterium]
MKRLIALRAVRLLKSLRIIPAHFTLEDIVALRLNKLSRAVLAPDATAEADLAENKKRLEKLFNSLSASERELAIRVRKVIRANRFDEYQAIYNELIHINGLLSIGFPLQGLARERFTSVLIKTGLRFSDESVVAHQLSYLKGDDVDWGLLKEAIFNTTRDQIDESEFLAATSDSADGQIARLRRAAYLQSQNRGYAH